QVDDLAEREAAVAPVRVDVEVAEQKRFVSRHQALTSMWSRSAGRCRRISDQKLRTYNPKTTPFPIAWERRAHVQTRPWGAPSLRPIGVSRRPRLVSSP